MSEFELALAEAQAWIDQEGVEAVGEGEQNGHRTIDVWVRSMELAPALPATVHGIEVRIREAGGEIAAWEDDDLDPRD